MTRNRRRRGPYLPELTIAGILTWADDFQRRTGRWPNCMSGPIPGSSGENWRKVDTALRLGLRGLPGKTSLALLLLDKRCVRTTAALPRFSVRQILAWADAHHRKTGAWPKDTSGPIHDAPQETWKMVDASLRLGLRGLPGGASLARVLTERRGVRNHKALPAITEEMILDWADEFHARTGHWPVARSGELIPEAGDHTTWLTVEGALRYGRRGLPGGSSLAQLLAARRGVRNLKDLPRLTIPQIVAWAQSYYRREGHWPSYNAGPVREAPDTTWRAIATSLHDGLRGLPKGISLARLVNGPSPRKPARRRLAV